MEGKVGVRVEKLDRKATPQQTEEVRGKCIYDLTNKHTKLDSFIGVLPNNLSKIGVPRTLINLKVSKKSPPNKFLALQMSVLG